MTKSKLPLNSCGDAELTIARVMKMCYHRTEQKESTGDALCRSGTEENNPTNHKI